MIDWKDVFVRAAKTAVATAIGIIPVSALGNLSIDGLEAAGIAAASAGATVIINAVLQWTRS
jgi:hypothetical protein